MISVRLILRSVLLVAFVAVGSLTTSNAAFAQAASSSCQADFAKIAAKRQVSIDQINKMTKRLGGKLDPVGACPLFRNLTATQGQLVTYVNANKNWCNIPDEVVTNAAAERAKFAGVAAKACNVAAQVVRQKKMQSQQAQGGGAQNPNGNAFNAPEKLRLPSGPL